ncbi:putative l-asparaginase ii protein [Lasiodiplodia theobromae]|uniref:L-asparaginase ii protein n=1 Tax=Lasiodiplodia theobromae TaxID=45133 RepID=A0A8H7IRD8_9PEZI|nr:putative l-asparaginase ii protein [Lasiodiplodia theobromae]
MARHPEQVGGEGRFCTVLMEVFGGALIGKIGADGCYGVGVRASEQTKRLGAEGAIGIAVKIEDGSIEILYAVVAELLEQLQIGTPEMRQKLAVFHHLKRLNTAQVVTGKVSLPFKVRPWCN